MGKNKTNTRKQSTNIYKHLFYFSLYNHFHENYSVLYKFQARNVRLVVCELKKYILENSQNKTQINFLIDEFFDLTRKDPIFLHSFDHCTQILSEIRQALERKDYSLIEKNIITLDKELNYKDKYLRKLQGFLSSFVLDSFFKEDYLDSESNADLFLEVTSCLIAELQSRYSRKYIDYLRERHLDNNLDFESAFDIFIQLLFKKEFKTQIKFSLKLYQEIPSEKQSSGYNSFSKYIKKSFKNIIEVNSPSVGEYIIIVEITSEIKDSFITSRDAKKDILIAVDGFLFEYNSFRIDLQSEIFVRPIKHNGKEGVWTPIQMEKPESHIHPKKESFIQKIADLLHGETIVEKDTQYRIENSLRYYSSFLHEQEEDKKLLNLWIAFENLFRQLDGDQDVFYKVKSTLINLSIIYYVREHCDELQNHLSQKANFSNVDSQVYYQNIIDEVREINENDYNSIGICNILSNKPEVLFSNLKLVKNNFYYVKKYDTLSKSFRSSPNGLYVNLSDKLNKREKMTSWQIARIYRKRNQIVHGHNPGDLKVELSDLIILEYFYHLTMEALLDFITSDHYKTNSVLEFTDKLSRSKIKYLDYVKNNSTPKLKNLVIPRIVV